MNGKSEHPNSGSNRAVRVRGCGLRSIAGNQPQALLGTVVSGTVAPSAGADYALANAQGEVVEPLVWPAHEPLAETEQDDDWAETAQDGREPLLAALLAGAIADALAQAAAEGAPVAQTLLLSLPDNPSAAGPEVESAVLLQLLREQCPELAAMEVTTVPAAQTARAFAGLHHALQSARYETALFAGVDSLVDLSILEARLATAELRTNKTAQGRAVGEGAACLLLQGGEQDEPESLRLSAVACVDEPLCEDLEAGIPRGLAGAAEQVLVARQLLQRGPDSIVLSRAETDSDEFEWFYARKQLWPVRLDESQRKAMRRGEQDAPQPAAPMAIETLRPALCLGDTGAASLALALVLAVARFDFFFQPINNSLLLHSPDGSQRLALLLERSAVAEPPHQSASEHTTGRDMQPSARSAL